jgi:hypothetical protein
MSLAPAGSALPKRLGGRDEHLLGYVSNVTAAAHRGCILQRDVVTLNETGVRC